MGVVAQGKIELADVTVIDVRGAGEEIGQGTILLAAVDFEKVADVFSFFSRQLRKNFFAAGIA